MNIKEFHVNYITPFLQILSKDNKHDFLMRNFKINL